MAWATSKSSQMWRKNVSRKEMNLAGPHEKSTANLQSRAILIRFHQRGRGFQEYPPSLPSSSPGCSNEFIWDVHPLFIWVWMQSGQSQIQHPAQTEQQLKTYSELRITNINIATRKQFRIENILLSVNKFSNVNSINFVELRNAQETCCWREKLVCV